MREVTTPDYIKDKFASMGLAKRIENHWHKKGYKQIRTWVDTHESKDGEKFYSIRSNIIFKVPHG